VGTFYFQKSAMNHKGFYYRWIARTSRAMTIGESGNDTGREDKGEEGE
jgi:hypothetical protein